MNLRSPQVVFLCVMVAYACDCCKNQHNMKLACYGATGQEKPAMIDAAGRLRDLSGILDDVTPGQLNGSVLLPSSNEFVSGNEF